MSHFARFTQKHSSNIPDLNWSFKMTYWEIPFSENPDETDEWTHIFFKKKKKIEKGSKLVMNWNARKFGIRKEIVFFHSFIFEKYLPFKEDALLFQKIFFSIKSQFREKVSDEDLSWIFSL